MILPRTFGRLAGAAAAALLVTIGSIGWVGAVDVDQILAEFDDVQKTVLTLSADFTETMVHPLLTDTIVAEGRFFMTKPDAICWEYTLPEEMRFVIASDEYTGYFPVRKRAEKRSVRRWSEQIFRFFGMGQGSAELAQFYKIELADSEPSEPGTYLLTLVPKKRRVRKRVEQVRFWIDASSYLPSKVEYLGEDGNTRVVEFRNVRLNPDLAAGLYTVEIPSDVTVTTGFSGLPSFGPGTTR